LEIARVAGESGHSLDGGDTESSFTPGLFGIKGFLDMGQKISRGTVFTSDKVRLLIGEPLNKYCSLVKKQMLLEELKIKTLC
jgi:hypothetical protein